MLSQYLLPFSPQTVRLGVSDDRTAAKFTPRRKDQFLRKTRLCVYVVKFKTWFRRSFVANFFFPSFFFNDINVPWVSDMENRIKKEYIVKINKFLKSLFKFRAMENNMLVILQICNNDPYTLGNTSAGKARLI